MIGVRDARAPRALLRLLNPVLRGMLRSPIARLFPRLTLIQFTGRRTGRPITVVVLSHALDGDRVVVTPAPWRVNFEEGASARIRRRNMTVDHVGTLDADPARVAKAINAIISNGTSPRLLGLRVEPGHSFTPAEVITLNRAVARFHEGPNLSPAVDTNHPGLRP